MVPTPSVTCAGSPVVPLTGHSDRALRPLEALLRHCDPLSSLTFVPFVPSGFRDFLVGETSVLEPIASSSRYEDSDDATEQTTCAYDDIEFGAYL